MIQGSHGGACTSFVDEGSRWVQGRNVLKEDYAERMQGFRSELHFPSLLESGLQVAVLGVSVARP